jgi:hypothetical protein
MVRIIAVFLSLFLSTVSFAQVLVGGDEPTKEEVKEEKPRQKKKAVEIEGRTSIYALANWSSTSRVLTENEGLYAEPLGTRADETSLTVWSYGLGFRNRVNKFIYWDGGISFYRNGESYLYEGADTMFAYQTYYNYISMPLRINFCYGKNFLWNAGIGLVPQMFNGYRQEQQWETTTDSKGTETIKARNGYNSFALSAVFNVGLTMNFDNGWGLILMPEARIQLTSTYMETSSYIHKARAYGFSVGLIRNI